MNDLRALIVSYSFPPVGGAGVARVLKLTKYLPAHGVTPTVLTVKNPSVPLIDHSLERDVAPGLRILRARTFEQTFDILTRLAQSGVVTPYPELAQYVTRELGLPQQHQKSESSSAAPEADPWAEGQQSEVEPDPTVEE